MKTDVLNITEAKLTDFKLHLQNNPMLKDLALSKVELILLYQLHELELRMKQLEERC